MKIEPSEREVYRIELVPADGPTLERRTREEWGLGYRFKVLFSDMPSFPRFSIITIEDLHTAEDNYPVQFEIRFKTQSVTEHMAQRSEHDYGFEQSWKLLEGM